MCTYIALQIARWPWQNLVVNIYIISEYFYPRVFRFNQTQRAQGRPQQSIHLIIRHKWIIQSFKFIQHWDRSYICFSTLDNFIIITQSSFWICDFSRNRPPQRPPSYFIVGKAEMDDLPQPEIDLKLFSSGLLLTFLKYITEYWYANTEYSPSGLHKPSEFYKDL